MVMILSFTFPRNSKETILEGHLISVMDWTKLDKLTINPDKRKVLLVRKKKFRNAYQLQIKVWTLTFLPSA